MVYPPELISFPNIEGYYLDVFNKVWTNNRKPVKCKICRSHIEWVSTYGYHCSDNLLHKIKDSNSRYIDN